MPPADFDRARQALEQARSIPGEAEQRLEFPPGYFRGKDPREEGIHLERIDLRGMDLSGARLEGLMLPKGKRVDGLNLTEADLTDAILPIYGQGVNLTRATAHRASFSYAVLPYLIAVELDGHFSDWFKAVCPNMNATGIKLVTADCREADFSGIFADYRGIPIEDVDQFAPQVVDCQCEGTDFTGIRIYWDGDTT